MIIEFLMSKDGLRVDNVDVSLHGIRFARSGGGLQPQLADEVTGAVRLTLADLAAAFARPEILNQLLAGVSGIARPEIGLSDAGDGTIKLTGSIELMGRRFPLTAFTRLSINDNRVLVSATQLEGLPMLGSLTSRLPSVALPLTLPAGLEFTEVGCVDDAVVVGFAGTDVPLGSDTPIPRPAAVEEVEGARGAAVTPARTAEDAG